MAFALKRITPFASGSSGWIGFFNVIIHPWVGWGQAACHHLRSSL
jgi:hypothetical protein